MILNNSKLNYKKVMHLLIIQIAFLTANFFFFAYAKNKIKGFLALFDSYGSQVATLQNIATNSTEDVMRLNSFLSSFGRSTNEAMLFAFIVVPAVAIIFWCIFQSAIWHKVRSEEIKRKLKFFFNYSIISSVILIPALIILYQLLQSEFTYVESNIGALLLLWIVSFVLLTLYSLSIDGASLISDIKSIANVFRIRILLLALASFFVSSLQFLAFVILFSHYLVMNSLPSNPMPLVSIILIAIIANSFMKIALHKSKKTLCGSKDLNLRRR